MKKSGLLLLAFSLMFFGSSFLPVQSQEKTKEEKERELRMQEEIEVQKKALSEQQKKLKEFEEEAKVTQEEALDRALEEESENLEDIARHRFVIRDLPKGKEFNFNFSRDGGWINIPDIEPYIGYAFSGDGEKSTWIYSKSLKDKTFSDDYSFDVEPTSNKVIMSVNGDCKSGEIRVRITMPSGKTYSDIAIDEFGNLNWRKSFSMSDEENQDKAGVWKFQIKASDASGYFKIALQTY
jgi:hypothetical protein